MADKLTDIETRIKLLLAKAESTDSPSEAEALSEAAMKLMVKHGIEAAEIDAARGAGEAHEAIVESEVRWVGSHAKEWMNFAWALGHAVDGVTVIGLATRDYANTGKELYIANVVGHDSDVRMFISLLTSLQLQAIGAQKSWWKTYTPKAWMDKGQKWRERAEFLKHFSYAAAGKIRKANESVVAEAGPSTAVMLRDRSDAVSDYISNKHSDLRTKRASRGKGGSGMAGLAGQAAGRAANTGGSSISSVRAIGG